MNNIIFKDYIKEIAYKAEENTHTSDEQPIDFSYVRGFEDGFRKALEKYNIVWK